MTLINFNNTYNLGSPYIGVGYIRSLLDLDEITISGNSIVTNDTNSDLIIDPAGTGKTRINNLEVGTDSMVKGVTLDPRANLQRRFYCRSINYIERKYSCK